MNTRGRGGRFYATAVASDLRTLTNEAEISFVGKVVGMYASSNGAVSDNKALFKYFTYK